MNDSAFRFSLPSTYLGDAHPTDHFALTRNPAAIGSRLDLVVRHAPVGIAVIDHGGFYLIVNPAYCAICGYREDELVGRHFTAVMPPTDPAPMLAMHDGEPANYDVPRSEWAAVRRDGTVVNTVAESVCIPGTDGHAQRVVYLIDVTERRRAYPAVSPAAQDSARSQGVSATDGKLGRPHRT